MLRRSVPLVLFVCAPPLLLSIACGGESSVFVTPDDRPGSSSGEQPPVNSNGGIPGSSSGSGSSSGDPRGPVCGNTLLEPGEVCDDGNTANGDGCKSDCSAIEDGFVCPTAGAACVAVCGDGKKLGSEQCDDGNTEGGDGCSSACTLEEGYKCPTAGAACEPTVCGDGVVEGTEQCDDGNDKPFDGCYRCVREVQCGNDGCAAVCGDGLVFPGEACDDGNTQSGDGCSATCQLEQGFTCSDRTEDLPAFLDLPVYYRDFNSADTEGTGHPDFESFKGYGAYRDLVKPTLGADGTPQFNKTSATPSPCVVLSTNANQATVCAERAQITSAASFADWYQDSARNRAVISTLRLTRNGQGVYVFDSTQLPFGNGSANGLFFPLDPKHHNNQSVGFGTQTGNSCRDFSSDAPNSAQCKGTDGLVHNFHFTTELRFAFTYSDPGNDTAGPELNFTGDDDVWIFINGRRVVDLGGLHSVMGHNPVSIDFPGGRPDGGTVKLTRAKAQELGMQDGHVYQMSLFHAERRTDASNFKLSLNGFVKRRTFCEATCGDGVKTPNEVCDDGVLSGDYGKCAPGCVWGPRCGDGIVQSDFGEQCDEASFVQVGRCRPDCTLEPSID